VFERRCGACAAGGESCQALNDAYAKRSSATSLPACLAAAHGQLLLDPSQPSAAAAHLASCDLVAVPHSAGEAAEAYAWLKDECKDAEAADALFKRAQLVHRWSAVFDGPERLPVPAVEGLAQQMKALSVAPKQGKREENGAAEPSVEEQGKADAAAIPEDSTAVPA
jgi:hypothetical protein